MWLIYLMLLCHLAISVTNWSWLSIANLPERQRSHLKLLDFLKIYIPIFVGPIYRSSQGRTLFVCEESNHNVPKRAPAPLSLAREEEVSQVTAFTPSKLT